MTLNARWAFFSEKKHNIGWGGACGRMTLNARSWYAACGERQSVFLGTKPKRVVVCNQVSNYAKTLKGEYSTEISFSAGSLTALNARWAFFSEKKNNMGWSGACGRVTLNARYTFFAK